MIQECKAIQIITEKDDLIVAHAFNKLKTKMRDVGKENAAALFGDVTSWKVSKLSPRTHETLPHGSNRLHATN